MKNRETCEHKAFKLDRGLFVCIFCLKSFSDLEIKRLMIGRRQGFDVDKSFSEKTKTMIE